MSSTSCCALRGYCTYSTREKKIARKISSHLWQGLHRDKKMVLSLPPPSLFAPLFQYDLVHIFFDLKWDVEAHAQDIWGLIDYTYFSPNKWQNRSITLRYNAFIWPHLNLLSAHHQSESSSYTYVLQITTHTPILNIESFYSLPQLFCMFMIREWW